MLQPANDSLIVSALRKGEVRRAVDMLLQTFNDGLYLYCASILGPTSGAAAYQRALAAAIACLASFDGKISLRAWLFAVTRRAVLEHMRQHPALYPEAQEEGYCPLPPAADDAGADPLERVAAADRELLQLRLWHGLRLREVAVVVGRPVHEVRGRAGEALQLYAAALRQSGERPS